MAFTRSPADGSSDTSALHRALAGYDDEFEHLLLEHISTCITNASLIDAGDGHRVMALRLGETANALTTVLASVLALSPNAVRSPAAIHDLSKQFRKKLERQVRQAERDPSFFDFKSRAFNETDRDRGGNA